MEPTCNSVQRAVVMKPSMCRICLAEDSTMRVLSVELQEVYETLTMVPFAAKDDRPRQICYICCAKLENCLQLRRKCLQGEVLFTKLLNGYSLTPAETEYACTSRLSTTPVMIWLLGLEEESILPTTTEQKETSENEDESITKFVVKYEEMEVSDNEILSHSTSQPDTQIGSLDSKDQLKKPKSEIGTSDEEDALVSIPDSFNYNKTNHMVQEGASSSNFEEKKAAGFRKKSSTNKIKRLSAIKKIDINNSVTDKRATKSIKEEKIEINSNESNNSKTNDQSKPYICNICHRCFAHYSSFELHTRVHTGVKPHQCDVCKKIFTSKRKLSIHFHTHTGEKPYKCDMCNKSFAFKGNFKNHIRQHNSVSPYQCDICKKSFNNKTRFNIHFRRHTGEKPYKCNECDRCYADKAQLKNHIRLHTGEKPYECKLCEKKYLSNHSLVYHIRSQHADIVKKPYQCDVCKKSFLTNSHLNEHIRIHSDEKSYNCNLCDKKFSTSANLNQHTRTHCDADKKPFKCDVCEKSFFNRGHLNQHVRKHTGERPYQCNICERRFISNGSLTRHSRSHSGIDENTVVTS